MHTQPSVEDGHQRQFLVNEAGALLTRLLAVKPFELIMPMVTFILAQALASPPIFYMVSVIQLPVLPWLLVKLR